MPLRLSSGALSSDHLIGTGGPMSVRSLGLETASGPDYVKCEKEVKLGIWAFNVLSSSNMEFCNKNFVCKLCNTFPDEGP